MSEFVHIVDDDDAVRDALAYLFTSAGHAVKTYASGEAFLADGGVEAVGAAVFDIRLGGISGLELHRQLKAMGSILPIVFLTGHGDVPLAVDAIKSGAHDFLEKPFDDGELLRIVGEALDAAKLARHRQEAETARQDRLGALSERERQILPLLIAGKPNKVIAAELDIAVRTVEVHRSRVLAKMGVRTVVELASILPRSTS
ncbi:response regulator transcription factor [Dongia sp.]|uniref:response regulator transcription factor n=1 Tax=Dongia sp. TaxID=1977262 RepID=UPI0035AE1880